MEDRDRQASFFKKPAPPPHEPVRFLAHSTGLKATPEEQKQAEALALGKFLGKCLLAFLAVTMAVVMLHPANRGLTRASDNPARYRRDEAHCARFTFQNIPPDWHEDAFRRCMEGGGYDMQTVDNRPVRTPDVTCESNAQLRERCETILRKAKEIAGLRRTAGGERDVLIMAKIDAIWEDLENAPPSDRELMRMRTELAERYNALIDIQRRRDSVIR